MNRILMFMILCVLGMNADSVSAQVFLRKAVVSNGGGTVTNSSTVLQFTVGETAAGTASNSGTVGQFGFWNAASEAADVTGDRAGSILSLQVTPNPAAKTLKATIELAVASELTVTLYDIKGTAIATLASGMHGPGAIEVSYDLTGCTSGVYFLAARVPGAIVQRQVTVVR